MELFDLVAKLTLDSSEYKSALHSAQNEGGSLQDIEVGLDLDASDFESKVEEAENTDVKDPAPPDLDLDDEKFDATVNEAESAEIQDPAAPELDLDDDKFQSVVSEAESTQVQDPAAPSLDLDTSGFVGGLSDAIDSASLFSIDVGSIFDGIKEHLAAAGVALGVKTLVDSLSEAVDLACSMGDNIDKSSQRLNISARAYQEWSHVMDINGASINDLSRGILNMNKLLGGGTLTEEVSGAFEQLGINAKIANGEITDTEGLLTETIKSLASFPGSTEDRGVLATAIFGRGGSTFNALFNSGAESIDDLIAEAHELGLVMSDEEVKNAAAYNDAVTNMQSSMDAFKTSLVTEILPVMTDVMNTGAKIIAFFNWRTGDTPLSKQFEDIDNGSLDALESINETESVASNLADKLIAMGDASKLTAEQQEVWKGTAKELIELVPSLSGVIDLDTLSIKGNRDEINNNIKAWANLAKQRALNQAIEEKQKALYDKNKEAIEAQVELNVKAGKAEAKRAESIKNINETLEKYGRDERLAEDASLQDIWKLRTDIGFSATNPQNRRLQEELAKDYDAYAEEVKQVETLEEKVAGYQESINAAQQEFEIWLASASELFGVLSDDSEAAQDEVAGVNEALNGLPAHKTVRLNVISNMDALNYVSNAKGNWDVPYDMPAILHRGETVLTTSEAREYREGTYEGGGSSDVVGAIQGMRNDLQNLRLVVGTRTFGRAVVDYSGNRMDEYIGRAEDRVSSGYGT